MHIDLYLVLGSAVVGLLVGLTGMGGGALMTPMLVLLFGVTPSAAIASDLMRVLHETGRCRDPLATQDVNTASCATSVTDQCRRRSSDLRDALAGPERARRAPTRDLARHGLIIGSVAIFYRSAFVTVPASGDEPSRYDHCRRSSSASSVASWSD